MEQSKAASKIQKWFRVVNMTTYFQFIFIEKFVKLQSIFRARVMRRKYLKVLEKREPWKEFLRPYEAVVLTSLVTKTSNVKGARSGPFKSLVSSKKQRQLIMTTGVNELEEGNGHQDAPPRIFYVDVGSRTWKGEVPYDLQLVSGLAPNSKEFVLYSRRNEDKPDKQPIWTFEVENGDSAIRWIQYLRRPTTVQELVMNHGTKATGFFHSTIEQGPMMMRQLTGAKKYIPHYFYQIASGEVFWIEKPGQKEPSGAFNITGECEFISKPHPRKLSGLPDNCFWLKIPCRVKPLKFRMNDDSTLNTFTTSVNKEILLTKEYFVNSGDPSKKGERLFNLGSTLFEGHQFLMAKIRFTDALDVMGISKTDRSKNIKFNCLEFRARCNFMLGLYEKSLSDCNEALNLSARDESCLTTRAACYEKLNRFQECAADYQLLSTEIAPNNKEIKAHAARLQNILDYKVTTQKKRSNSIGQAGEIIEVEGDDDDEQEEIVRRAPSIARQDNSGFASQLISMKSGRGMEIPRGDGEDGGESKTQGDGEDEFYIDELTGTKMRRTSSKRRMTEEKEQKATNDPKRNNRARRQSGRMSLTPMQANQILDEQRAVEEAAQDQPKPVVRSKSFGRAGADRRSSTALAEEDFYASISRLSIRGMRDSDGGEEADSMLNQLTQARRNSFRGSVDGTPSPRFNQTMEEDLSEVTW